MLMPLAFAMLLSSAPSIETLHWLEGTWRSEGSGRTTEETWTSPEGGMMLGVNRAVAHGRVVHFEYLRIETSSAGLTLVAKPSSQPETRFDLVHAREIAGGHEVVFENVEHDWPTRITYRRREDVLEVRAEGRGKTATWTWRRLPCR